MSATPRSWLFTPGSRPDRSTKAAASTADALILDLEDSVAEDQKAEARDNVIGFLKSRPAIRQEIAVRINPINRVEGLEETRRIGAASSQGRPMC